MRLIVVSVFDRAADAYGRPVFVASVGQAIRSFQDEVNRVSAENEMNRHPDDFDLYKLGVFDDESGAFTCELSPVQLAIGKQLVVNRV